MAKNSGEGYRIGIVKGRTQVYNPKTEQFIKRDTQTGQFLSSKESPYKNIKQEKLDVKKKEKSDIKKEKK